MSGGGALDVEPLPEARGTPGKASWTVPLGLMVLTFASMLYVGSDMARTDASSPRDLLAGWTFAVPLMAILLAHELGHYFAGRIHGVDVSPPYFIPMPLVLFGTMGAIIRMRGPIQTRNALLDVGAAGPIAGMVVALPVLVYGIATSPIERLSPDLAYMIEGRSLLYSALLWALKGPIPAGHDIMLTPTALAGWVGLLVTMINLIPVAQLDGGHVAYALLGRRQDAWSERIRKVLPLVGIATSLFYASGAMLARRPWADVAWQSLAGAPWLTWAAVLWVITRLSGREHPETGPEPLSPRRRAVAIATLATFALLFMPAWLRVG